MMSNLPRFESGSEGSTGIKVSRYWMDKIENKKHPVIAARRYEGIKRFDEAVWEDGDGSMHTKRLVQSYRNFLKTYPDFPFRAEIQLRIEELKKHTLDIKGELPPGV